MFDRARYAITETCLALTIFHEELTARVFALFTALLFSKVFHWLAEVRVSELREPEESAPACASMCTAFLGRGRAAAGFPESIAAPGPLALSFYFLTRPFYSAAVPRGVRGDG